MKNYLLAISVLFLLSFIGSGSFAQNSETIDSDRPGQTNQPTTVGTGIIQLQSGFAFDFFGTEPSKGFEIDNQNVLRFGLSKRIEVNAIFQPTVSSFGYRGNKFHRFGLTDLQFGARYHLTDQSDVFPSTGLIANVKLPYHPGDFADELWGGNVTLASSYDFGKVSLSNNIILNYNAFEFDPNLDITLVLAGEITDNLSAFAEVFGTIFPNGPSLNYDAGLAYAVSDDLVLDAAVIVFPSNLVPDNNLMNYSVGLSKRW